MLNIAYELISQSVTSTTVSTWNAYSLFQRIITIQNATTICNLHISQITSMISDPWKTLNHQAIGVKITGNGENS